MLWTDPSGWCSRQGEPACVTPGSTPTRPPTTTPTAQTTETTSSVYLGNGSDCIAGAFKQVAYNATWGFAEAAAPKSYETVAMIVCRQVGNTASILVGAGEFFNGAPLAMGGIIACGTGVMCIVGVPIAVTGGLVAVHGTGMAVTGAWQLVGDASELCNVLFAKGNKRGGSSTPTPQPSAAPTPDPSIQWTPHRHKHVPQKGLTWKEIVKSTRNGEARYHPNSNIEEFERAAWTIGTPVNGGRWRVSKYSQIIGAKYGKEVRWVGIEINTNTIHGHPITEAEYRALLQEAQIP